MIKHKLLERIGRTTDFVTENGIVTVPDHCWAEELETKLRGGVRAGYNGDGVFIASTSGRLLLIRDI